MSDLQKEIDLLKARLDELEDRYKHESGNSAITLWQPKGDNYWIDNTGSVVDDICNISPQIKIFGLTRSTRKQAECASIEMRRFNRLLAIRDELCGDDLIDWSNPKVKKIYLYLNHGNRKWDVDINNSYESIQVYFTTIELAQQACDMLNSGEVEL